MKQRRRSRPHRGNRFDLAVALDNDRDPDGDSLMLAEVGKPRSGRVRLGAGGTLTYSPEPGTSGEDRFHCRVCDVSGACSDGIVTVTVLPQPNRAPLAADDVVRTKGTPVTFGPLANDRDPDGDRLVLTSVTQPGWGTFTISGSQVTYTPGGDLG